MSFATATLTGTYKMWDNVTPAQGTVEIMPNSKALIDAEGDVILSGRVKVKLGHAAAEGEAGADADGWVHDGSFSVTLPATDDTTVEPATNRQYAVSAKLKHTGLKAVTGIELATDETVDMADVTSGVETAAAISQFLTAEEYAADMARVAALEGVSTAQATALAAKLDVVQREQSSGVAGLTAAGKLYEARIPDRLSEVALGATYVRVETPEAHGAVGNGIADDTVAVQAALTALGSGGTLRLSGKYKVTAALTIPGAASGLTNWTNGAIRITGDHPLKSRIISTFAGTLFTATSRSFVHVSDLLVIGPGIATAGSRAFFFDTTPRITMDRVFVRDFEVGLDFYDCTGGVFNTLQVHYCGTGLRGGYNFDAQTFNSCDFKYCGVGLQLGWSFGALGTGDSQFCNAITFLDTMFAYCTTMGVKIIDKAARGVGFLGSYWEGNPKDVEIGVSGRGDLTGPSIHFERCEFSATVSPPVAVGIDVYTRPTMTMRGCSTDGNNRYTVFVKLNDINGGTCVIEDSRINAVTAALQVGSRNFNTTLENREAIRYGKATGDFVDTVNIPAAAPIKETRGYNSANRTLEQWGRYTTGNVEQNRIQVKDYNGQLHLEGTDGGGGIGGYIAATSVAALPTASVNLRGCLAFVPGNGTSTADQLYVCLMSATGTYNWKQAFSGV